MKVAGFGFRTAATHDSLLSALEAAGGAEGVARLATLDLKAADNCILALSEDLRIPLQSISGLEISSVATPTQSPASLEAHGVGSVAEAAALVAAGRGAVLLAQRAFSQDRLATCAIALGGNP